ncbi:MAG: arylsulfatase [Phycisphaeraceae bacterium]|nr:arylsulfatase [Phycisphaeraceae bacterium]
MRNLAILAVILAAATSWTPAQRPNVVLFFIDDLGWADLGCYGSTFYSTPHLDALAKSGVRFTDAYSACPVCSPTRAALMTGKYPQRCGITQWIPPGSDRHLDAAEATLGEAFLAAGYRTGYIGKWHLGERDADHPRHHGFPWTFAVNRAGQPSSYYFPYKRKPGKRGVMTKNGKKFTVWDVPDLANGKDGDYLTDRLTDAALRFITAKGAAQKPFMLCFAHYAIHTPIQPPPALVPGYQQKAARLGPAPKPIPGTFGTTSRARQDHAKYAAMMENLDHNVGRVLEALRKNGLSKDTIVVFASDNGGLCNLRKRPGPTCNLPMRSGKGWTYEGGIRVPFIVSWPGKIEPSVSMEPSITMDIYPTLLDLCGLASRPKQHLDGVSLRPALDGKAGVQGRALGWSYPHGHGSGHRPSAAWRKDGWKLVRFERSGLTELFHLAEDAGETVNLADRHPERVVRMSKELDAWLGATAAK